MMAQRLTPEWLDAVAELEKTVFTHPWSAQALTMLCAPDAIGVLCAQGEMALAYGGMIAVLDEGQITNIATHPAHRRKGLGSAVLKALLKEARVRGLSFITLEVRESNHGAIALYEKFGFSVVGRRPRFYTQPTEAALIMKCILEKENGE